MNDSNQLFLHEEITLLALHDEKGTSMASFPEHLIAGAVLAELLLTSRISVDGRRKKMVQLQDMAAIGEPIMDECLKLMRESSKPVSLRNWVSKFAKIKNLKHKAAQQLCARGILQEDESSLLIVFTQKVYKEVNATPEQKIVERMRTAIFSDDDEVDPRTVVLIALANGVDLLPKIFGSKEVRARKKRIKQIINGEIVGKATQEVIEACQAAVMAAIIIPVLAVGVGTSS